LSVSGDQDLRALLIVVEEPDDVSWRRRTDLTGKQQQLRGLISAGLYTSSKAQLLDVTSETVWTASKRLRKRMGLGPGQGVEDVVAGVG